MPRGKLNYNNNGVFITPNEFEPGDRIRLTYDGLLSQSGATEVFAHVGYGASRWDNVSDIKMTRTTNGFEATFPITSDTNLNVAFKDVANNWDNNSGKNYTFKIK